jgi:hypothetical protein
VPSERCSIEEQSIRILWMGVLSLVMWCALHTTSLFLLGILIFRGLTVQCLYMSFGSKGLKEVVVR